ncbi:MAG: HU family DNA-binding protein [Candidatus Marinimicrobia bacterium]|nr:HU family DNA-binding protein [Candidatus Neomarinimicrobiota bacterium]
MAKSLGKSDLVASIAEEAGLTKAQADKAVNAFISTVQNVMKNGEKLTLVGFGTFSVAERGERNGVNPKTGEKIIIPAGKSPKFKAGKGLKDMLKK